MQPYIYKITDTRNNMQYVGQHNGKQNSYFSSGIIIDNIFKKYSKINAQKFLKKEIIVQGDFNQVLLNELEKHYIRLYATRSPLGYNLTDGGEGISGHKFNESEKQQISNKLKDLWATPEYRNKMLAAHATPERFAKMSKLKKGIKKSPEVIEKTASKLRGKTTKRKGVKSEEWVIDKIRKKVAQYSLNGDLIKIWNSIKEAHELLEICDSDISQAANGKAKTAGGFVWRHVNKDTPPLIKIEKTKSRRYTKIAQYSKQNELIKIWDTIIEASMALKIRNTHICDVAKNKPECKTAGGFIWRYVTE